MAEDRIFGGPTIDQFRRNLLESDLDAAREEIDMLKMLKAQSDRERERLTHRVAELEAEKKKRDEAASTTDHATASNANADKKLITDLVGALRGLLNAAVKVPRTEWNTETNNQFEAAEIDAQQLLEIYDEQKAK